MSLSLEPRIAVEGGSVVVTPRVRSTARRVAFWIGVLLFVLLVGLIVLGVAGTGAEGATLSGTNAAANGSKALVQVLRQNGVTVSTPRSLDRAIEEATASSGTTLALYDAKSILGPEQLDRLAASSDDLILIDPSAAELRALAPGVTPVGTSTGPLAADCSFPPVERAGEISGGGADYRVDAASGALDCLGGGGAYSLIRLPRGGGTTTVFGASDTLTNRSIAGSGNAALALGLFGQTRNLVWYLPGTADLQPSASDLPLPGWVLPTATLGALLLLAAAFWRGRRFGPLVIERLPVVVRASETMEGRARLYRRASARTHALDALRIGTITRLALLCGLPRLAGVEETVGAVATATGRPPAELRALLVDRLPTTDAQLLRLSDELLVLEREVAAGTRPR
jgi:hypothetical protein